MSLKVKKVSIIAGLVNIFGVIIFSQGFTNTYLTYFYPNIFPTFGLLCIMLWGLAYIAAGYHAVNPALYGVFAFEKFLYFMTWWGWMMEHGLQLGYVYHKSSMAGVFYALYGPVDLIFSIYFFWIVLKFSHVNTDH